MLHTASTTPTLSPEIRSHIAQFLEKRIAKLLNCVDEAIIKEVLNYVITLPRGVHNSNSLCNDKKLIEETRTSLCLYYDNPANFCLRINKDDRGIKEKAQEYLVALIKEYLKDLKKKHNLIVSAVNKELDTSTASVSVNGGNVEVASNGGRVAAAKKMFHQDLSQSGSSSKEIKLSQSAVTSNGVQIHGTMQSQNQPKTKLGMPHSPRPSKESDKVASSLLTPQLKASVPPLALSSQPKSTVFPIPVIVSPRPKRAVLPIPEAEAVSAQSRGTDPFIPVPHLPSLKSTVPFIPLPHSPRLKGSDEHLPSLPLSPRLRSSDSHLPSVPLSPRLRSSDSHLPSVPPPSPGLKGSDAHLPSLPLSPRLRSSDAHMPSVPPLSPGLKGSDAHMPSVPPPSPRLKGSDAHMPSVLSPSPRLKGSDAHMPSVPLPSPRRKSSDPHMPFVPSLRRSKGPDALMPVPRSPRLKDSELNPHPSRLRRSGDGSSFQRPAADAIVLASTSRRPSGDSVLTPTALTSSQSLIPGSGSSGSVKSVRTSGGARKSGTQTSVGLQKPGTRVSGSAQLSGATSSASGSPRLGAAAASSSVSGSPRQAALGQATSGSGSPKAGSPLSLSGSPRQVALGQTSLGSGSPKAGAPLSLSGSPRQAALGQTSLGSGSPKAGAPSSVSGSVARSVSGSPQPVAASASDSSRSATSHSMSDLAKLGATASKITASAETSAVSPAAAGSPASPRSEIIVGSPRPMGSPASPRSEIIIGSPRPMGSSGSAVIIGSPRADAAGSSRLFAPLRTRSATSSGALVKQTLQLCILGGSEEQQINLMKRFASCQFLQGRVKSTLIKEDEVLRQCVLDCEGYYFELICKSDVNLTTPDFSKINDADALIFLFNMSEPKKFNHAKGWLNKATELAESHRQKLTIMLAGTETGFSKRYSTVWGISYDLPLQEVASHKKKGLNCHSCILNVSENVEVDSMFSVVFSMILEKSPKIPESRSERCTVM